MSVVTRGYDAATALLAARLVELAYTQFDQGLGDPSYDGAVTPPAGWDQVAAFRSVEIDFGSDVQALLGMRMNLTGQQGLSDRVGDADSLSATLTDPAQLQALVAGKQPVFWGFALKATTADCNVVVLRGTRTPEEWVEDATAVQVPVPLAWFADGRFQAAKAHLGFLFQLALLYAQVQDAAKQFDNGLPTLVCGHSLGSGLGTLAAVALRVTHLADGPPVAAYLFASPRVGDPVFVDAYDFFVPQSFRVTNLSDVVPVLPPPSVSLSVHGVEVAFTYGDAGTEWSYLWQTGDVGGNHALATNYLPAAQAQVPTDAPRAYPASGL